MASWHKWIDLFDCKEGTEDVTHFLLDRPFFKENVDSVFCSARKFENLTSDCSPWALIAHNIGIVSS